jgi:CRISPR system Cascade subunit CasD
MLVVSSLPSSAIDLHSDHAAMSIFTIHITAPMISLQGHRIDGKAQAMPIPTRSMITGMMGAALGVGYSDHDSLQAIQDNLRLAVVVHRPGVVEMDYQTADLGKPHMIGPMWTHDGQRLGSFERTGGDIEATRQQWRPYTADASLTVLVELFPDAPFRPQEILAAFDQPAHPIGLGRMCCPPAGRVAGASA